MPKSARVNDMWSGTCCCHSDPTCVSMVGIILTSSLNCKSDGRGQARVNDLVIGNCGHTGFIITGSNNAKANTLGKARVGDQVSGCMTGVIITGSSNHNIN